MKKIFAKLVVLCLMVTFAFNLCVFANIKIYKTAQDYDNISGFLAYVSDPVYDSENKELRFKNGIEYADGTVDTNTYIIDENTLLSDYVPEGAADISWVIDGRAKWITIYIPIPYFWEENFVQNSEIRVAAADGIAVSIAGIDPTKSNGGILSDLTLFEVMVGDENGKLNLSKPVTRAEMAQFIVNILCLKNISSTSEQVFSDVDSSHWAYDAVQLCAVLGIVNGNGDGTFAPDNQVRHEEVIKMIVSTLGYAPLAEQKGGYPNGYCDVAEEINLTTDFNFKLFVFSKENFAIRRDVALLLNRALNLPVMKQTGYGSNPEYTVMNGDNGMCRVTLIDELLKLKNQTQK